MLAATSTMGGAAARDREAMFAELVAGERDRAVALAYHLTGGDRALAEDVAQEAFLRAYRGLSGFRGEARLSTWFLRIVVREAASARRREGLRRRLAGLWPRPPGAEGALEARDPARAPDEVVAVHAMRRRIGGALARLPAGQRVAFALVHLESLTIEEAAGVLGKAPGTVKSHLHRALRSLRRELADL